jgi:predicted XRE-type DNA-binding protein
MEYADRVRILKIMQEIKKNKIKPMEVIGDDAPPLDQMKFNLCQRIIKFKKQHGLNNQDISKILEVGPAVISRIFHCQIVRFKVDSLLGYYFALLISTDNDKVVEKFKKEVASFLKNVA